MMKSLYFRTVTLDEGALARFDGALSAYGAKLLADAGREPDGRITLFALANEEWPRLTFPEGTLADVEHICRHLGIKTTSEAPPRSPLAKCEMFMT
jgi:hypothetical protein